MGVYMYNKKMKQDLSTPHVSLRVLTLDVPKASARSGSPAVVQSTAMPPVVPAVLPSISSGALRAYIIVQRILTPIS